MIRRALIPILIALASSACGPDADPAHVAEIDAWHEQRLEGLRSETGWLTLVGLHPLREGAQTVGCAPGLDVSLAGDAADTLGVLTVAGGGIAFAAHPDAGVVVERDDSRVRIAETPLATDRDAAPTVLGAGTLRFHVIDRAGDLYLRVKDSDSSVLKTFTGVDRFPVRKRWRVTARLEGEPGVVTIPDVLGRENESPTPGVLVFELEGTEYRVTPQGERGGDLFLIFGDGTNGRSTYGAGRFLAVPPLNDDGTTILDFNRAFNPPCVFTKFATCPLPPPENVLSVAVEAGERMWGGHH